MQARSPRRPPASKEGERTRVKGCTLSDTHQHTDSHPPTPTDTQTHSTRSRPPVCWRSAGPGPGPETGPSPAPTARTLCRRRALPTATRTKQRRASAPHAHAHAHRLRAALRLNTHGIRPATGRAGPDRLAQHSASAAVHSAAGSIVRRCLTSLHVSSTSYASTSYDTAADLRRF